MDATISDLIKVRDDASRQVAATNASEVRGAEFQRDAAEEKLLEGHQFQPGYRA